MDYSEICRSVCEVARKAGEFIRLSRADFDLTKVEHKGTFDLVSYVDKGAEKIVVEGLKGLIDGASFLTEEGTVEQGGVTEGGYLWVIDPLDGTTNFVHGFSPYCVSIGLMCGQEVVVGVVYEVTKDECFSAFKGGDALLNGTKISVSEVVQVKDSLVVAGFAHKLTDGQYQKSVDTFDLFNRNTHGVRRTGSAAANLVDIAAGRAEVFYQVGLSPWDVAAGVLIVQLAGGRVVDFNGGDQYVFGREVVASNGLVHDYFEKHLKN